MTEKYNENFDSSGQKKDPEIEKYLQEHGEEIERMLEEISDEELEEFVDDLAAQGNEFAKKLKVDVELDLFEEYLGKDIKDEYFKAFLRGKIKENAEFVGTVKDEDACRRYEKVASAARFFEMQADRMGEDLEFSYTPPHPTRTYASVAIDLPTCCTLKHSLGILLSDMVRWSNELTIAEGWSDDPSEAGTLGVRMTFTIDGTWS